MPLRPVESEPANVAIIFDSTLRVRASSRRLRQSLRSDGHRVSRRPEGLLVHFEANSEHLSNPSLIALLQKLASEQVAFALDYKQAMSPADHVSLLIERGIEFVAPMGCAFDGENWLIVDLPVAESR